MQEQVRGWDHESGEGSPVMNAWTPSPLEMLRKQVKSLEPMRWLRWWEGEEGGGNS